MKKLALASAVALTLAMAGCAPSMMYPLPVSAADAPRTFAPLLSVASSMGLRYAEFDDSVHIQLDESTWAFFEIQNDDYNLGIVIYGDKVPKPQRAAKFAWAKKKADLIWAKAMAAMRQTAMPVPATPPAPPPAGTNVNIDVNVR